MTILNILQDTPWWAYLGGLVGGVGIVNLILYLLGWVRYGKSEKIDVDQKEVNVLKTKAEIAKAEAEVKMVQAQALQANASGQEIVLGTAFKVIERLNTECEMAKKQGEKTQRDLEHAQENLEKTRKSLNEALNTISDMSIELKEIRHALKNEEQKNMLRAEEIKSLTEELIKLRKENGRL